MATTISAFDHKSWEAYGLKDYGDFAECTTDCNVEDDGADCTRGEWFYIDDEPLTVEDQGTFRVIYYGSWGNYNSPGASSYTYADLFDVDDELEMRQFAKNVAGWVAYPEYVETDDDEEDESEENENDDDGEGEPQEGDWITENYEVFREVGSKLVVNVPDGEDWRAALRERMEHEQFFPNVWFVSDHGNTVLLSLDKADA